MVTAVFVAFEAVVAFVASVAVAALPPILNPAAVPVMLVPTSVAGVPKFGATKVGLVANTATPVPVSSVKAVAKAEEVKEPNEVALPLEVIAPVKFALVEAVTPVNEEPSPTNFVAVKAPVLGINDNLVSAVFCGKLPVLAVTKVG